jgi:scyllo-inositol 2-dehydrogenase (NADP+)
MRTIKTALCSFGMSGWVFHAPFLHIHPGFELYGVWERSKKEVAQKYPGTISFDTYEELLNDKTIELVIVNTPNYTHFEFAKKALLSGKNIIVEKPFCVTEKECDELIALAKEKGLVLSVYQNRRYDSDYKIIKKVVERLARGYCRSRIPFRQVQRYTQSQSTQRNTGTGYRFIV